MCLTAGCWLQAVDQKSNFKLGGGQGIHHKIEKLMCYKTMEQTGKKGL